MQQNQNPINQNEVPEKKKSSSKKERINPYGAMGCLLAFLFLLFWLLIWQIWKLKEELVTHSRDITEVKTEIKEKLKEETQPHVTENTSVEVQRNDFLYLIYSAQQYLTLQKDVNLAIQSLRLAREQMDLQKDNTNASLKIELDKEIKKLEAIEVPRSDTIMQQLSHLSLEVEGLLVRPGIPLEFQKEGESLKNNSTWKKFKQNFESILKKFIVVRHEPLKTSSDFIPSSSYLVGQIQLWLLKAQWAVFKQEGEAYRQNLESAIALLSRYFVQDEKTQRWITSLESLKAMPIDLKLPDLSNLLDQIKSPSVLDVQREKKKEPDSKKEMPAVEEPRVLSS